MKTFATARATGRTPARVAIAVVTAVALVAGWAAVAPASAASRIGATEATATEATGQTYTATGAIVASNPISPFGGGITENDFLLEVCAWPPVSQGLDGYVFQVPEAFGEGTATATVTGSNALNFYDLNLAFFTSCGILSTSTTSNPDESAPVPGATRFIIVNAARGIDTLVALELSTGSQTEPTPDPTPSQTQSASPTPTATQSATPGPSPTQSESPTATPTPTETASATPSPTQSEEPSPTPSASESENSSATEPPAPDPTPPAAARGEATTTIATDHSTVRLGAPFMLSGSVAADDGCARASSVEVSKRLHGTTTYAPIGTAPVAADGSWELEVTSARNASYIARPQDTGACDGLASSPVDGFVRVDVAVNVPRSCDAPQRVTGTVTPRQPGTHVLLQKRTRGKWATQDVRFLHRGSSFRVRAATCSGRFRVVWPTQDERNVRGARRFSF
jgi:hypothetical protein